MRLDNEQESSNVEDRRGMGMPMRAGGVGIGTVLIALAASYFFGVDPGTVIGVASQLQGGTAVQEVPARKPPADDEKARFISKGARLDRAHLAGAVPAQLNKQYEDPKLVLFTGATPTACGTGQTAMGPFYCPLDRKVYIDLAFYQELKDRFHAPGDFAQAYVIAHEVGHHVQNLLGISDKVHQAQQRARGESAGQCAVGAAGAAGRLPRRRLGGPGQRGAPDTRSGRCRGGADRGHRDRRRPPAEADAAAMSCPTRFTHGTSEQRVRWFKRGIDSGDMNQCNTFKAASL